jgi:hypothetical protein
MYLKDGLFWFLVKSYDPMTSFNYYFYFDSPSLLYDTLTFMSDSPLADPLLNDLAVSL